MPTRARDAVLALGRVALWAAAALALLAGGLYLVGVAVVLVQAPAGAKLGDVQHAALSALFGAILRQALVPHMALTLVSWLVVTQIVPSLERSWRRLVPALVVVAAIWFPLVGGYTFEMWEPGNLVDVVNTASLLSGSVAAALLLPRWLLPPLRPGRLAFAALFRRQNPG